MVTCFAYVQKYYVIGWKFSSVTVMKEFDRWLTFNDVSLFLLKQNERSRSYYLRLRDGLFTAYHTHVYGPLHILTVALSSFSTSGDAWPTFTPFIYLHETWLAGRGQNLIFSKDRFLISVPHKIWHTWILCLHYSHWDKKH